MTSAVTEAPVRPETRSGLLAFFGRLISRTAKLIVGVLLCLTPVTALIALGWLTRKTGLDIDTHLSRKAGAPHAQSRIRWPNWILGQRGGTSGRAGRLAGGLTANLTVGLRTLAAIGALVLPFGILWLMSWWAGWENSFNKGYEQAWVGPVVAFAGIILAVPILVHLPMALAHHAYESAWRSMFYVRRIRALVSAGGWPYVGVTLLFGIAALPLFAFKAAPVFMEQIYPEITGFSEPELRAFAEAYHFWGTVYLFLALVVIRSALARTYARAARAACNANPPLWEGSKAAGMLSGSGSAGDNTVRHFAWVGRLLRTVMITAVWLAFVAQVYVGQFFNHSWVSWVNQPLLLIPWLP